MNGMTLIWSALTRRKARSIFTLASVIMAFVLFCVLAAVQQGMSGQLTIASAQRLRTQLKISTQGGGLPLSYGSKIASVPGVTDLTYDIDAIHGYFRESKNRVRVIAFAARSFLQTYPEFHLTAAEKAAWLSDRQGAIVGEALAKRMGWKVGGTIPIQGGPRQADGGTTWYFHLDGIYHTDLPDAYREFFVMHYVYANEGAVDNTNKDKVFEFIERIDDPRDSERISTAIDKLFENSSPQTLTQSEQIESISRIRQFGNITAMVVSVGVAVFFALLLIIGNNLAQSVRERIAEFAMFRTLGFTKIYVVWLIAQESLLLVGAGGVLGLIAGVIVTRALYSSVGNILQTFGVTWAALAAGFVLSLVLGALAALIQAQRVMRLRVADALRKG